MSRIFVVKHYIPGDFANVLGIAEALSRRTGYKIEVIDAHSRLNLFNWIILFIAFLMRRFELRYIGRIFWHLLFSANSLNISKPSAGSIVISTLGRGEPVNVYVSALLNGKSIHLGSPKRMPRSFFDMIITHPGNTAKDGEVILSVSPNRIKYHDKIHSVPGRIAIIVGGNAPNILYNDAYWINFVKYIARAYGSGFNDVRITSSPRSGKRVEDIIRMHIDANGVNVSLWNFFSSKGRLTVQDILEGSEVAIVTCDSVSMVSEAVSSGVPVIVIYDKIALQSKRVFSFLHGLSSRNIVRLVCSDAESDIKDDLNSILPYSGHWSEEFFSEAVKRNIIAAEGDNNGGG